MRTLMAAQTLLFAAASLLHRGVLADGYEHPAAATAEGIIALVLAVGLVLTWVVDRARLVALATQGFALVGTAIGVFLVLSGVGPSTPLDIGLHLLMVALLVVGLAVTWVGNANAPGRAEA